MGVQYSIANRIIISNSLSSKDEDSLAIMLKTKNEWKIILGWEKTKNDRKKVIRLRRTQIWKEIVLFIIREYDR